ncbi:MAG: cytochrome c [Melioribacteraceae bacterium]|nr:cytochrome c [Melioribacteraceae bacterium]
MTNAQKWIVLILVIFSVLFLVAKMTEKEESIDDLDFYKDSEQVTETVKKEVDALSLMASNRCFMCHTKSLAGSGAGPDIRTVSENWEKEDLVKYLKNPKDFADDLRLAELRSKYRSPMTGVNNLTDEEITRIADYLLNLK